MKKYERIKCADGEVEFYSKTTTAGELVSRKYPNHDQDLIEDPEAGPVQGGIQHNRLILEHTFGGGDEETSIIENLKGRYIEIAREQS